MKRRLALFALLAMAALELPMACSESVPLAGMNALCEFDEQCASGLACRCVRRRNPDDEGPDEILQPGVCQTRDYRCASDAGVTETSVTDTGTAPDTSSDTSSTETSDAPSDAVDGG